MTNEYVIAEAIKVGSKQIADSLTKVAEAMQALVTEIRAGAPRNSGVDLTTKE
jgi:hypothetical protein